KALQGISDVHLVSKLESLNFELELSPQAVLPLLSRSLLDLGNQIKGRSIRFDFADHLASQEILVDPTSLGEALQIVFLWSAQRA
ncbi:hypothetical protein, partial [Bacillus velezensis]|uniref:hypothetical protein n=1 Tax=Bacillus velezensis TaxID=492670 RepID=UPI0019597F88